jgi:hypothetical protein
LQANGTVLSGTLQTAYFAGTPPNEGLGTTTDPVSGQFNGSQISLSRNGEADWFGTISGNSFTLDMPQSDGSLAPVMFQKETVTQFDQAVATMNGAAASANAKANQAAAAAAAEQAREYQADMAAVIAWCHTHGAPWANDQSEYQATEGNPICRDNAGDFNDFGPGNIISLPYPSAWSGPASLTF